MAHAPLPVGHHTADEVAELLGTTKRQLYKRLREWGWLIVDKNGVRGSNHNLPRKEISERGWIYPVTCSYGTGPNKEISKEYRIPAFTQEGYRQIHKIWKEGAAPPEIRPARPTPIRAPQDEGPSKVTLKKDPRTLQSRAEALQRLREIGL